MWTRVLDTAPRGSVKVTPARELVAVMDFSPELEMGHQDKTLKTQAITLLLQRSSVDFMFTFVHAHVHSISFSPFSFPPPASPFPPCHSPPLSTLPHPTPPS
jgi:hypothetical protein